jgi:small GTP-binding protein
VTLDDAPQVVATAGHVDHGKSSLIVRLTGIDPDRLAEEKRRGLTIDLGFAWTTLPSGREIGFVDVPGHERFVRNMLAGVGPVRLVMFVVAADEGWKPQSEEHLEIVDVLGAAGGVVALTKADLVDEETLGIAELEVRERLEGTSLDGAPIVPCSAATGAGLDDLAAALDAMVAAAPARGRTAGCASSSTECSRSAAPAPSSLERSRAGRSRWAMKSRSSRPAAGPGSAGCRATSGRSTRRGRSRGWR